MSITDDVAAAVLADGADTASPAASGSGGRLPAVLPVEAAAEATVATALLAAARLAEHDTGRRPEVALDRDHVAAAVTSERWVRVGGAAAGAGFAPLSRFWPTADGWVRTHANYPWHREALLRALDLTGDDPAGVADRLRGLAADEAVHRITSAGGVAAAMAAQHRSTPAPQLVGHSRLGDAPGRPAGRLRVLDLTRVIAGPVGARWLSAFGADVLRLDPPQLPELPVHRAEGLLGKRSALLDLRTPSGLETFHVLLDGADVVVHGYRPGALRPYGLDLAALAERHPGIVSVQLSAWGADVPRRGFDSIVQAASGIALVESPGGGRPGALPCQLLDHGTGYLVAAAALDGVLRQRRDGGTHLRTLSLTATARWLLALPRTETSDTPGGVDASPWLQTVGEVTAVRPPGSIDGEPLRWRSGLPEYGGDSPVW